MENVQSQMLEDQEEIDGASRRQFERKEHRGRCRIVVQTLEGDYRESSVWTQDISATGLRFRSLEELPVTGVYVQLPGMTNKATVIRIVRTEELMGGQWEYGAKFTGVVNLGEDGLPEQ